MVPLAAIQELFEYNYWAQDRQLEACSPATQEQFSRPIGGSFPSLRDTLAHLVDGEEYALRRWKGESRQQIIDAMGYSNVDGRLTLWPEQFPTFGAVRLRAGTVEGQVRRFLSNLTNEQIAMSVSYTDSAGRTWAYPLWRMLVHHITHQTYHRGQVTTLLRQLGITPAKIDFLEAYDNRREDIGKPQSGVEPA